MVKGTTGQPIGGRTAEMIRSILKERERGDFDDLAVASSFNLSRTAASQLLRELFRKGLIEPTQGKAKGKYQLTQIGRDVGRGMEEILDRPKPKMRSSREAVRRPTSVEIIDVRPSEEVLRFLCRQALRPPRNGEQGFELPSFHDPVGPAETTEQLVSRGLIEPVVREGDPRMVKGRKFQLTDAGRRAGLEAAPDFRWQAAGSRIVPAETHIDRMRCLIHLHRELARLGGLKLSKYQEQLATDIADGLDEEALAAMHDWWNYDRNALFVAGQERPNRPRLDLVLELTSKGNLAVTWRPSVINPGQRDPVCNWVNWRTEKNRGMAFVTRPSNELLFLHNVDEALDPLRDLYPAWKSADQGMIDTILLQGAVALVEELKNRLSWNFTVTMITDIFMNWNEFKSELWPDGRLQPRHVLTSWAIEDVKEREERLARAEFECFPQESGVPLNVFVASVAEADKPMPSGAAPSRDDREKRISKALLAAGYGDVIPAAVRQYWELIERFRPEFLPRPPGTDAKVVPFRKR